METDPPRLAVVILDPRRWPRWVRWASLALALGLIGWGAKLTADSWWMRDRGIIGTMRSIAAGERSFCLGGIVDQDGDGSGEHAWLGELAGTEPCRVTGNRMDSAPYVARILGTKDAAGRATQHGHYVHLALPIAGGGWKWEPRSLGPGWILGFPPRPDADVEEQRWVAYAWPVRGSAYGSHTLVTGWTGEVYRCDESARAYSGGAGPAVDAALDAAGSLPDPPPAGGWIGRDGNRWQLVPRR